jgi:hypothetical protein
MSTKNVNHTAKEISAHIRTILSNNGATPAIVTVSNIKDVRLALEKDTVKSGQTNLLSSSFSFVESLPGY